MKNKYGLSRNIPEPVKRAVRQACGFGCVICGCSIIEYAHVDPEFPEAREHNPSGITLLCPRCHSKLTTGFLSKETVRAAMAEPFCKKAGFSSEIFDLGSVHPQIVFGGVTLTNCRVPVRVKDLPLFELKEGEGARAPFRLTANFFNSKGQPSLMIRDNEWFALASNWDVEVSGGAITIRDEPKHVSLQLVVYPPGGLIVERLDMYLYGYHFRGSPDELIVESPGGLRLVLRSCLVDNCEVGLALG
ncbi:MAG: HNH endonuclease signature motif containing protein [Moorellales bacterium]